MNYLSLLLIACSFLGGAFVTVLHPTQINWLWFVPLLLVGVTGLWLLKRQAHAAANREGQVADDMQMLERCLDNIVKNLLVLQEQKKQLPPHEARFEIDRLFREDLTEFAESRKSMIAAFGLQHYADVMSGFAAGERYINRVWSASADGYIDEVHLYLDKAAEQFADAQEHFLQLKAQS